jgi:DNA invertase Pin-like site-specific DNA recombinase
MSDLPRIFCYARSSTKAQDESPECQLSRMREKCAEMEAQGKGKLYKEFSENVSATEVAWTDRKEFKRMVEELDPGDIVYCWTLTRIDRNPIRMLNFAQYCMNRNVRLFLLKEPMMNNNEVDMSTAMGRAFLHMGAIFNDFWLEHHREAVRSSIAYRKANGMVYNGVARGKKRIYRHVAGKSKAVPVDSWDMTSCRVYAEIYTRWKYGNESIRSIARDINRRQERHSTGGMICGTLYQNDAEIFHCPNYMSFQNTFSWIRKHIEENDGWMGDVKTPYWPDPSQMHVKPRNTTGKGFFILRD